MTAISSKEFVANTFEKIVLLEFPLTFRRILVAAIVVIVCSFLMYSYANTKSSFGLPLDQLLGFRLWRRLRERRRVKRDVVSIFLY